jgi:acetyl/propionyl-CoA carboxylase alpha subunit
MKYVAIVNGKQRAVEIARIDGGYRLTIDGKSFTVDSFRPGPQSISLLMDGQVYEVGLEKNGHRFSVYFYDDTIELELFDARKFQASNTARSTASSGPTRIQAPMPGKIVKVVVKEQSTVKEGDSLLIMEAMKMQNELKAPKSGTVSKIHVREGEPVSISQVLLVLE